MNPVPANPDHPNLRLGRPPVFTEEQALRVLRNRILAGEGTRLREFIREEAKEGTLSADVSPATLYALFSGRMYPALIDPATGVVFDYSKVPRAPAGRPTRFVDGVDPVTLDRKRGVPPLRQWLLDKTLMEARDLVRMRSLTHYAELDQKLGRAIAEHAARTKETLELMEARIAALEAELRAPRGSDNP